MLGSSSYCMMLNSYCNCSEWPDDSCNRNMKNNIESKKGRTGLLQVADKVK